MKIYSCDRLFYTVGSYVQKIISREKAGAEGEILSNYTNDGNSNHGMSST